MNDTVSMDHKYLSTFQQIIITTCYVLGILGNLLALIFLRKKKTRPNNQKHRLMLNCLSANDLTALLGMLILMYIQLYLPVSENVWFCRARVIWRVFGLGSGCVAIVMAAERWLAITKPFFYQKHVTVVLLRRCIFTLWIFAVVLVCMPFFGFGLYYDKENKHKKCLRYRTATTTLDITYAYLYFVLGIILCLSIVFCNIAVMRFLCFKGTSTNNNNYINNPNLIHCNSKNYRSNNESKDKIIINIQRLREPILVRRMSRTSSKISTASTREELAFGRLMGVLCIIFIMCWLPQLLTIPLAQSDTNETVHHHFYKTADILMALHFLLDPYMYVWQRLPTFRRFLSMRRNHHLTTKPSFKMLPLDHNRR